MVMKKLFLSDFYDENPKAVSYFANSKNIYKMKAYKKDILSFLMYLM